MRKTRLKSVSPNRIKKNKIYSALRKKFLEEHPFCQLWICQNYPSVELGSIAAVEKVAWADFERRAPRSVDIHHRKGRGKHFLDVSTWMAVSREGHDFIHKNPKESYEKGWMLQR